MVGIWKTKEGKEIKICDMSDSHLLNAIKMLSDKIDERIYNDDDFDKPINLISLEKKLDELKNEAEKRNEYVMEKNKK